MNKKRKLIWDKSGGKCWYCGCELPEKGWHADHFEPVVRCPLAGVMEKPEKNNTDNLVPACAPCNLLKSSLSIEVFRGRIEKFIESLNRHHNQYKFAKRYGMVTETQKPVVFWFEENGGADL